MSRVAFSVLAAVAVSLSAAGTAQAGCGCNSDYAVASVVVQPAPVLVQPAPVMVAVQPPPVLVQPAPIVQQYIVDQGPRYAGPMLTDYYPQTYYAPRAVGGYPYVSGYRAAYAPRPYRPYPGYPPIRRYY